MLLGLLQMNVFKFTIHEYLIDLKRIKTFFVENLNEKKRFSLKEKKNDWAKCRAFCR